MYGMQKGFAWRQDMDLKYRFGVIKNLKEQRINLPNILAV